MAMASPSDAVIREALQPPYISYRRFQTLLDQITSKQPPDQLNPISWGAPSQGAERFTNALRFFGLVSRELAPAWHLRQFAGGDALERRKILRTVVLSRFPWLAEPAKSTSYQEFQLTLARYCSLTGEPLARAAKFVLSATKDLAIETSVEVPRRGPRAKSSSATGVSSAALFRTVENYSAFLLQQVKRSTRRGDVDRDLLEKLDRLSHAILESRQTMDG